MSKNSVPLCKLHPDFHVPKEIKGVGEKLDGRAYTAALKEHNVDTIVMFAKCHYGYSYYPTKIGTVHPGLVKDMVKEVSEGAKENGLESVCYYSVFLDTAAVEKNPSWRLQSERIGVMGGFDSKRYEPICVNSPYLEELLIPQTLEILKEYYVQQMFYDTMSGFHPCYCPACVKKFGRDIPSKEDEGWLEYVKWYRQCYWDFFARVTQAVHGEYPEVECVFNWEWSINHPEKPVPYIKRLAGDLFPSGRVSSFYSRYWSGTKMPFDYMNGRFMHGLGDWSSNTDLTLQYTAASTMASGGGVYLIDRQLPDGRLEDRSYSSMDAVFSFVNSRRDWVVDTTPVPEIAVLTSSAHLVGSELEFFPSQEIRRKRLGTIKAMGEILAQGGVHFTFLNEPNLIDNVKEYSLVILPELLAVSEELIQALTEYVNDGGKVLIMQGEEEMPNSQLMTLAGVSFAQRTPQNYTYVEFSRDGKIDSPFVVRGENSMVLPKEGTDIISHYVEPLESNKGNFGHGIAPPVRMSKCAAATCRKFGKGQVVYLAPSLLTSYVEYYNPDLAQYLVCIIDTILSEPLVQLKTDALIEKSLMRQGDDLIIHLVNHSGRDMIAGGWCPIIKFIPKLYDISLTIKQQNPEKELKVSVFSTEVENAAPDYEVRKKSNGEIEINKITLHVMESIRICDYFKDIL